VYVDVLQLKSRVRVCSDSGNAETCGARGLSNIDGSRNPLARGAISVGAADGRTGTYMAWDDDAPRGPVERTPRARTPDVSEGARRAQRGTEMTSLGSLSSRARVHTCCTGCEWGNLFRNERYAVNIREKGERFINTDRYVWRRDGISLR